LVVQGGNDNVDSLIETPKVDPDSEWYQGQMNVMHESRSRVDHPMGVMWTRYAMSLNLAMLLFGTRFEAKDAAANKPDLTNPDWQLKSHLPTDDVETLKRLRMNLQLLKGFISKPKSERRVSLVCSQDAFKPDRMLQAGRTPARSPIAIADLENSQKARLYYRPY